MYEYSNRTMKVQVLNLPTRTVHLGGRDATQITDEEAETEVVQSYVNQNPPAGRLRSIEEEDEKDDGEDEEGAATDDEVNNNG